MRGMRVQNPVCVAVILIVGACSCPKQSQVEAIEGTGGKYVGELGYHGACRAQWLWFDRPIDDEELGRLAPAIKVTSPETLQLTGQTGITDASIDWINGLTGLKAVYLDGSGISEDGVKRIRPDIRVVHGEGYN